VQLPPGLARHAYPTEYFATNRAIIDAFERDLDRILERTDLDPTTGCWVWRGGCDAKGYPVMSIRNTRVRLHRAMYWWFTAPIRNRLVIDHLCRNHTCINPQHLEAVPQAVNVRRGNAGRYWADKTHCPAGHPYAGDNLYIGKNGNRKCKTCNRERTRRYRARAKAAA
jgi:hypothetical protein